MHELRRHIGDDDDQLTEVVGVGGDARNDATGGELVVEREVVFRRGTEPIQYANRESKSPGQFYLLDQGDAAEAPKKYNPEEITD